MALKTKAVKAATKTNHNDVAVEVDDKTADPAGVIPKELKEKARKMTEAAMIRKFYTNLARRKTGTHGVESKAYKFVLDRKSKEGVKVDTNEDIIGGRDPEMVVDMLNIKIKYAKRSEEQTKNEYEREMNKVQEILKKGSRRWRKLREKLQTYKNYLWESLDSNYNEKMENLVHKYNAKTIEKKSKEDEEDDKLMEGVVVNDKELKEMLEKEGEAEIPQYGELTRPIDEDEKALLRLNPKFAVYSKIDMMKIREEIEITKT